MKILVTGAAGFIGSNLCEKLCEHNEVIGVDNFCNFYSPQIKERNLELLLKDGNFKLFRGDIRDDDFLVNVFGNNIDLVIHLAAMAGVRPSLENPRLYSEVNINGTINLLEHCKSNNIKKFIFASSSSVYGNNKKVPFSENDRIDNPISIYAATKKAGELICHTYHHLYNISIVNLRFFTVYGPRQRPDLAIHKFTKMILNNESIPVFGDGTTERDYTYIDDIINGVLKSIDFVKQKNTFETFNLGESQTISLMEMIQTIEDVLGKKALKKELPLQPGDVERTYADISRSKKVLGYNPHTNFKRGIEKFVEWYKKTQY